MPNRVIETTSGLTLAPRSRTPRAFDVSTSAGMQFLVLTSKTGSWGRSTSVGITFTPQGWGDGYFAMSGNHLTFAPLTSEIGSIKVATSCRVDFLPRGSEIATLLVSSSASLAFHPDSAPRLQIPGDAGSLTTAIRSDCSGRYPFCFADTNEGRVLLANGIDPMLRWDGSLSVAEAAGVPPPIYPIAFRGLGLGAITGTYVALERFVDRYGQVSDPSPVGTSSGLSSSVDDIPGTQGNVTSFFADATVDPRILVLTSKPHGLTDGETVTIQADSDLYSSAGDPLTFLNTYAGGTWVVAVSDAPTLAFGSVDGQSGSVFALVGSAIPTAKTELRDPGTGSVYIPSLPNSGQKVATVPYLVTVIGAPPAGVSISNGGYWYLASEGNPSTRADRGENAVRNAKSIEYSGLNAIPLQAARRQILRNTDGQLTTFYVDVDTSDLTSTTFSSTRLDADLSAQEAVPILDDLGRISAAAHGVPPSHKSIIVSHQGRVFAAVDVPYREGHVELTPGEIVVNGVGTAWPETFAGRFLYVAGSPKPYEIADVDVARQRLELTSAWSGPTNLFARYGIAPAPAERKLVYYSEAGLSESWPATNAIGVQEDGDEVTGLMSAGSYLYVLEARHIYRFTFKDDPAVDGGLFQVSQRGCLTNRLWAQVEGSAYMLDDSGIHVFSGGTSESISQPVQDLFQRDSVGPYKINWDADPSLWHAQVSRPFFTIRWFVAMTGTRLPRHAICTNYRTGAWWVEEYKRPVSATAGPSQASGTVLSGSDHREVLTLDAGTRDGVRPASSATWSGAVSSSGPFSLADASAHFDPASAPGLAVFLVSGRGKGQWRRIVSASSTVLRLDRPWLAAPDATTRYAVGGIDWAWRSGEFRMLSADESNARDVEVVFQPLSTATPMDLELTYNHGHDARVWSSTRAGEGTALVAGSAFVAVDLAGGRDRARVGLEGHAERNVGPDAYVNLTISGVQMAEAVRVYRVTMSGVEAEG